MVEMAKAVSVTFMANSDYRPADYGRTFSVSSLFFGEEIPGSPKKMEVLDVMMFFLVVIIYN